jgi:alkanesulfonate monooxygenase SsuD/methylene tetrahydromethanopterin reductase-like flavin-dependent oxidoreductase (luciferase family)
MMACFASVPGDQNTISIRSAAWFVSQTGNMTGDDDLKFALFTHVPWPEGIEPTQIFRETSEQVEYGEELGFCSAWIAEHHFSRYSMGSSSLVLASHIAARTTTIRLGTAVLLPTLHHPIRLAEDTATMDAVSGGRLDVGFGRGADSYEYGGFNVDHAESQLRFQESIRIIQGLWTTPEFSFDGQYFQFNKLNLVPPPVQQPHPPIYLAASNTLETLKFVVSTGHNLCIAVVQDTAQSLDLCRRFVAMSKEAGFNVPMSAIPFFRYFYVAETEAQARKDTEAHINWILDIMQWRRVFREGSEVPYRMADWRQTRTEATVGADYIYNNRAFIGTPEQCAANIKGLQEQGIEYFGCNFAMGGIPQDKVLHSMALFAKEVMPRFQE